MSCELKSVERPKEKIYFGITTPKNFDNLTELIFFYSNWPGYTKIKVTQLGAQLSKWIIGKGELHLVSSHLERKI